ncbi:MAG: ABC transporter ATP-binding protein [Marinoscillum sp.]
MNITLEDVGKKYNRQWVFRHLEAEIKTGDTVAITGHNGSGKSTLIQIMSNFITPSEGEVKYSEKDALDLQTKFSFAAPYQNLIEEFTLSEHLQFHSRFKKPMHDEVSIIEFAGLGGNDQKLVKEFSSGMKQRLRLAIAFFYESSLIFLDEPTSNLDQKGIDWYQQLITGNHQNKTIIIASNQSFEYELASQKIQIEKFKS